MVAPGETIKIRQLSRFYMRAQREKRRDRRPDMSNRSIVAEILIEALTPGGLASSAPHAIPAGSEIRDNEAANREVNRERAEGAKASVS